MPPIVLSARNKGGAWTESAAHANSKNRMDDEQSLRTRASQYREAAKVAADANLVAILTRVARGLEEIAARMTDKE
jgi:hypothetical protein